MAKEIVRTRAAKNRMFTARAQMNSVLMQLHTQQAMVRAAGCMEKSTDVMKMMNSLVKLPGLQKTMMEMSREMHRAGLIEETMADAFDMLDGDSVEQDADNEVNKVVTELTGDLFKGKESVPSSLPAKPEPVEAEQDEDLDAMRARLQVL